MFEDVNVEVSEVSLKTLTDKANEMVKLEEEVEEKQASLKRSQKELKVLSEEEIPALLSEVGLSEITLTNGKKISTNAYYYGRITEHNQQEAFTWLQDNGHGDIIKNVISVSFGRDEDVNAEKLLSDLQDNGYSTNGKKWVEPMTLKAFIREQVESGNDLPLETFNVYVGQKTRIIK
jgi:predicted component of viral defense system (DUF524 family)|tara:strand:- start:2802 stop:3332 length:531 start_codon:yes stop_codon:yes gene_type:complete